MKQILSLLFFLVNIGFIHAQSNDSAPEKLNTDNDSLVLLSSTNSIFESALHFDTLDFTNLQRFQNYKKYHTVLPVAHMGNNGLGFQPLTIEKTYQGIYGVAPAYSNYFFNRENIRFYQTSRPLTEFGYVIGAKSESYLKLLHTQNFGKYVNIAANYHRLHSEGFYFRQLARQSLFNSSANVTSRDSSYHAHLFYAYNSVEAYENGGIVKPDSAEIADGSTDLLSINLEDASSITQNNQYFLKHSFDLGSMLGWKESIISLDHEFHYSKIFRRYTDKVDSANQLYDHFYLNIGSSNDSSYAREYYNSVGFSLFSDLLSIHYRILDARYFQNHLVDRNYTSDFLVLKSAGNYGGWNYGAFLEKGLAGYQQKDIKGRLSVSARVGEKDKIVFTAGYSRLRPGVFAEIYKTNHLFYDTSFSSTKSLSPSISYSSNILNTSFKIGFNQIRNLIYYDKSGVSKQLTEDLFNPYIRISNHIDLGSKVVFTNEIQYQQNDKEEFVTLPDLLSRHSLYYQNIFFKESMLLQAGVQFQWISEYSAIGYFPESNRFHLLQNGENFGNIKQVDLFVNARIDNRFRLSVKLENLTAEEHNRDDFRVEGFPVPGKVYKVILSWALVN